jgi:anti-sigma regulatory factor (Ser/Thr protein kinase)
MSRPVAAQQMFTVAHGTDVANARRWGMQLAASLGFDETTSGKLAIVITEAATNILKHAVSGTLLIGPVHQASSAGIEVLALDRGPGIPNLAQSLRDGISTTGTSGTGLGAMDRLADEFDAWSAAGAGTAACMRIWADKEQAAAPALQVGAVCVPVAGEEVCGDAWAFAWKGEVAKIMIADGLGHGPDAAKASNAAVKTMQFNPERSPEAQLGAMHDALRPTRGAAVAVMELQLAREQLNFAGIGNISACVMDGSSRKQLVSHNGIVGHNMRKVQQFSVPCSKGSLCILCSDGIGTQWDLDKYPGLQFRHPALIAGVIYRDFVRGRDDATVVAVRYR